MNIFTKIYVNTKQDYAHLYANEREYFIVKDESAIQEIISHVGTDSEWKPQFMFESDCMWWQREAS